MRKKILQSQTRQSRYKNVARRQSSSIEKPVLQLVVLIVAGCAFSPFLRGILLWVGIVVLAVLFVFVVYCIATRTDRTTTPAALPCTHAATKHSCHAPPPAIKVASDGYMPPPARQNPMDVKSLDWFQFEKLVAEVYRQQGYQVQRMGGANPDGGIDLIVSKDGLTSAIQCKHWKSWKIGVKQIREFLGALADRRVANGIFVTLQEFTSEARELAARHSIQLIRERELMQMLEAVNWRYNPAITSIFNDTRKLCPKCESEMVLRTARKGNNAGAQFWGCSTYPKCRFVMNC